MEPEKLARFEPPHHILPFNSSDEGDRDELKVRGYALVLINQLKQSKSLNTVQYSAIKNFTDGKQDAVAIGKKLNAEYVLESNYKTSGGRLWITSELHNVNSGLVEETYSDEDIDLADKFKQLKTFVAGVEKKLVLKFNLEPFNFAQMRGTTNEEAQGFYFQGMNLTDKRRREDAEKAVLDFEEAIRLDPEYADAYVGLAYAHTTAKVNGADVPSHCAKAREAVERALNLDANLAEAYSILAMNQHSCLWQQTEAENSHRKAIELAPNSAFTHRFYGIFLTHLGRVDESVKEIKKAIELEQTSLFSRKQLGRALFFGRKYDDAIEQLKKTRELDSNDDEQSRFIYLAYEMKSDYENAFEWFLKTEEIKQAAQTEKTEDDKKAEINAWRKVYAESGWQGVLRRRLEFAEQMEKAGGDSFGEIASLAAQLGEKDKAFDYLGKEIAKARLFATQVLVDPTLDTMRSDPRFDDLIRSRWKT